MSKHLGASAEPSLSSIRETSPAPSSSRSDMEDNVSTSTTISPDSPPLSSRDGAGIATEPTSAASSSAGGGEGRGSTSSGVALVQNPETITAETLDSHMYTAGCPPLDLFIRTSGVTRLSDFLLWQCHRDTHIRFVDCYWPEFDLWQFIPILLEWQWRQGQKAREERQPRRRGRQTIKDRAA